MTSEEKDRYHEKFREVTKEFQVDVKNEFPKTKSVKMKLKLSKLPKAPKKPTRPFTWFLLEVRKSVQEEMGLSSGDGVNILAEVSKECGRRWAILTQEEKEKYLRMFREDNKRYQEDVKSVQSSPEFLHKKFNSVKKLKLSKLLKAPKKPTRPFIWYLVEVRKSVQEELGLTSGDGVDIRAEVSKECGRRWAILTSEEKEKYYKMFREDIIRCQEDAKNYQLCSSNLVSNVSPKMKSYFDYLASSWATVASSLPGLEPGQVQEEEVWRRWCKVEGGSSSGEAGDQKQNVVKKTKKRLRMKIINNLVEIDGPELPKLAFDHFLSTMKKELEKCLPDMSYNLILKHVSAKWKVMTDEQKLPFFDLGRVENEKYEIMLKERRKKDLVAPCYVFKESDHVSQSKTSR